MWMHLAFFIMVEVLDDTWPDNLPALTTQDVAVQPIYITCIMPAPLRTWPDRLPVGHFFPNLISKHILLFIFYGKLRTKLRLGDRSQVDRCKGLPPPQLSSMFKCILGSVSASSSSSVLKPKISSLHPMGPPPWDPQLTFPDHPLLRPWTLSNFENAAYLSLLSEARVVLRCGFRLSCISWSSL